MSYVAVADEAVYMKKEGGGENPWKKGCIE